MRQVQAVLKEEGHPVGEPDGRLGPATREALREFQQGNGPTATGRIDVDTIRRMGDVVLGSLQNPDLWDPDLQASVSPAGATEAP